MRKNPNSPIKTHIQKIGSAICTEWNRAITIKSIPIGGVQNPMDI